MKKKQLEAANADGKTMFETEQMVYDRMNKIPGYTDAFYEAYDAARNINPVSLSSVKAARTVPIEKAGKIIFLASVGWGVFCGLQKVKAEKVAEKINITGKIQVD